MFDACSSLDACRHTISIIESHLLLDKEEQKEFTCAIELWAQKNADIKPTHYAYARLMLGYCRFYAEEYDVALPIINDAERLFTEMGDLNSKALCQVLRGNIYRTLGNFDLALQNMMTAEAQLSNAPLFLHYHLAALLNIGGIYLDTKHYDEAIAPFRKTLELAEAAKRYYWMIYSLTGLGKSYAAMQNPLQAKECFQKALDAAAIFDQPASLTNSLGEMASYLFLTGNLEEAEVLHKKALALREKHNLIGGAVTSCIRLGEIYVKQGRYDEAETILNKGLEMGTRINVKLKMYQVHFILSEMYGLKKDLAKSLSHYKLYNHLRTQVEEEDSARNIKNARVVFEAEQTKKENAVIKQQKEMIEKKNIELQETIDKLTRARIGKKARAITLVIAIGLFLVEDLILHSALTLANTDNYFISIVIKIVIIFSLSPINKAIEGYLLKKVLREKRQVLV